MYTIVEKDMSKFNVSNDANLLDIEGFIMSSRKKAFQIKGSTVTKIKIVNNKLAYPLVSKKVLKKYQKLIIYLTDLLLDDDESGETCREALNQIEKFRLEIKNKYRKYLKKKELEKMSNQLVVLQKEASRRLLEIMDSYKEINRSSSHK